MKNLTYIIIIVCIILFVPSILFNWVNVFFTSTTIIYLCIGGLVYLAVTGVREDFKKNS